MSQVTEQITALPDRIQTRRTSRSNRSSSPNIEEDQDTASPFSSTDNQTTASRITRSQSVESNDTDSRKRKRKTTSSNTNNKDESDRETRTSRNTKETRDAKKAKRDIINKERLDELDKLEQAVKNGTHAEYHELLETIKEKKNRMTQVAEMRRSFAENNVINFFHAQKYAADSQYNWNKLALRRSMIQHVQHKINLLEQEYYSNHVSNILDEDHLTEWVPPDRPSMISSLTLGLSEEEADHDLELARGELYPERPSPPLDMLASLADHHQQDALPSWRHKFS